MKTQGHTNRRVAVSLAGALLALSMQATGHDHSGMNHPGMVNAAPADAHAHHMALPAGGYTRAVRNYTLPDIDMVDADGRPVALQEVLAGEGPVMLNFIFTTCTAICPVMSATFSQVQKLLGDEGRSVRMVSISIDPDQDTPKRLKEYATRFKAGPEWQFLTGTLADSVMVQRAFDTYRGGKMNHVPLTLIRTGPNKPWLRLEGLASAEEIVREYRKLTARSAAPSLGQNRAMLALFLLFSPVWAQDQSPAAARSEAKIHLAAAARMQMKPSRKIAN